MKTQNLSPEQFAQYEAIVNEYDRYRKLSQEEKEDLIIRIATSKYIDLMCDWAFKHVFGHNEKNLMLLLNDILPEQIVHIEYEPNEVDLWKGDDKKIIMDVICHTKDGRRFIVEMQRGDRRNFRPRMLFYSAALLYTQLKVGDSYGKLMPGYVICFMNFRLKHDYDKLIYQYRLSEVSGEPYSTPSLQNIYLCELPRLAIKPGESTTPIEVWFDILQNMSNFASRPESYGDKYDSIFESSLQSPITDKDKLQYFRSMFDDEICSYLSDEDKQEIAEEFYAKGIEQGIEQGIKQVAIGMLKDGLAPEQVAKYSGLTPEQLAKL